MMAPDLRATCRSMLMGDLNMVNSLADKTRQSSTMVSFREQILFNANKSTLGVRDNPQLKGSLKFSLDNNRLNENKV